MAGGVCAISMLCGVAVSEGASQNDVIANASSAQGVVCVFSQTVSDISSNGWAHRLNAAFGATIDAEYNVIFKGIAFHTPHPVGFDSIRSQVPVSYCEPNLPVYAVGNEMVVGAGVTGNLLSANFQRQPSGQIMPWGVARVGGPYDGTGRHVWIVDTGVDLGNRDLVIGSGANFVPDARGRVPRRPDDDSGHGTAIAGIIEQPRCGRGRFWRNCASSQGS